MAEDVVIRISARNLSKAAFKDALKDVAGLEEGTRRSSQATGGLGLTVGRLAGALGLATVGLSAVNGAMRLIGDSVVGFNANLEQSTLQFTTLIGDADEAQKHVRDLFDFAKRTPFETPGIIQASKFLRQFGGEALDNRAVLTLLGDASAATGAQFQDLAFWTGRLFAQLQAGKPFGEAAQRLTELAVLTPKARAEMEELQKNGGSAAEVFALFESQLSNFTGAMALQADTWAGLTSTFWENVQVFIADRSVGAFELLKSAIRGANSVLETFNATDEQLADLRLVRLKDQLSGLEGAIEAVHAATGTYNQRLVEEAGAIRFTILEIENKNRLLDIAERRAEEAAEAERKRAEDEERAAKQSAELAVERVKALEEMAKAEEALLLKEKERFTFESLLASTGAQLFQITRDSVPLTMGLAGAMGHLTVQVRESEAAIGDAHAILAEFATQLEQEAPPTFFESLTSAIKQELSGLDLGGLIVGAFQGGGNVGQTIGAGLGEALGSSLGNQLKASIGGSLGSVVGGFLGPLGAVGGGLLGKGLSALFGIGGPDSAELEARELVRVFEDTLIGGLTESQAAEAAGERWRQVVVSVRDTFVEAGHSAEEGVALVQRLWDAIQDGGPAAVAAVIAEFEAVEGSIGDVQAAAEALAAEAVTDFDAMERAAEKYGIGLNALGPEFKRARIHEEAQQILADFRLLSDGGANVDKVLEGMGDEVSEFLERARKFGTSVPEDMRPMLEDMLAMGALTDASGEKLENLDAIKFATGPSSELGKIEAGIDKLVTKMGEFIDRLTNIPDAQAHVRVVVDDRELRELGGEGSVRVEGFRTGTDTRDFGPFGTLIAAHGREAIVPEQQFPNLAREMAAQLAPLISQGGGGVVVVNGANRQELRRELSTDQLRAVERVMRGGELFLPTSSTGERA